ALIVLNHGTDAQRQRFLPRFARGDARGGLALTEPHAGTDVQAIRTVARRRGDDYVLTGTKLFITNGREGNTLALLALTDPRAEPRHRGIDRKSTRLNSSHDQTSYAVFCWKQKKT